MNVIEIKKKLDEAITEYQGLATSTATDSELREASLIVKKLQAELSSAITHGAEPCPQCNVVPHGIEQPSGRRSGGVEYEIGCLTHTKLRVRGGLLPRHAVETWNELVAENTPAVS